jgi:hypothetical protein
LKKGQDPWASTFQKISILFYPHQFLAFAKRLECESPLSLCYLASFVMITHIAEQKIGSSENGSLSDSTDKKAKEDFRTPNASRKLEIDEDKRV